MRAVCSVCCSPTRRAVAQERARMHARVLQVFESHFASVDAIVARALEAIRRRVYRRAF